MADVFCVVGVMDRKMHVWMRAEVHFEYLAPGYEARIWTNRLTRAEPFVGSTMVVAPGIYYEGTGSDDI